MEESKATELKKGGEKPIYKYKTEFDKFELYENRLAVETPGDEGVLERVVFPIRGITKTRVKIEDDGLSFYMYINEDIFTFDVEHLKGVKKLLALLEEMV